MKKLFGLVAVVVLAMTFGLSVRAETIKVFAVNAGQNKCLAESATIANIQAMLNDETKDVDFGYFCGPKGTATTYFNVTDANYTFDVTMPSQAYGGIHAFAYRTDRYDLVKRYDKVSTGNGAVDACVVQNKTTGVYYALVMPTGSQFNNSSSGKITAYQGPVKTVADKCLEDYPTAKVFVGTTLAWGATYSALQDYLTSANYMGLVEARVAADPAVAGGIYYAADSTISNVTVENVALAGAEEPATVAMFTYSVATHTVVFKDYKGDVIDTQEVDDKAAAVAPTEIPTPEGMVFYEWSTDFSCVESDLEVTATYIDPLTTYFTVKFLDINGDEIPGATQQVLFEQDAVPPLPPEVTDYVFLGWDGDYTCVREDRIIESRYRRATVPVGTVEELVSGLTNFAADGADYILTNDIDLAGVAYVPVDLYGNFDGDGYSISNLTGEVSLFKTVYGSVENLRLVGFSRTIASSSGIGGLLAECLKGGSASGVVVENGSVFGSKSTCTLGSLVGVATSDDNEKPSVVSNCVAKNCSLRGVNYNTIGGLVGMLSGGSEVVDCCFLEDDSESVSLNGSSAEVAGGIVGSSEGGSVRRCYVEGSFTVASGNQQKAGVGGIVGFVSSKRTDVVDCTNEATVVFANYNGAAGGIVGRGQKNLLVISGCVNKGAVSVTTTDSEKTSYAGCGAGGIFGGSWGIGTATVIVDCRNEGAVVSEDTRAAGGILGEDHGSDNSDVVCYFTNCVNVAAITSPARVGGIVGRLHRLKTDFSLVNCGNMGMLSSPTGYVGGVAGVILGVPQNNDKNFQFDGIYNVMNCGTLVTESGNVGKFVGLLAGSDRNAYEAQVKSGFFADCENTDIVGLVSGKDGTGVTIDEMSDVNLAASKFTDGTVVDLLNVYAAANRLSKWVQKEYYPDLAIGEIPEPATSGLLIFFR